MVTGIVVTHGNLGESLLDTARGIIGEFSDCLAISNSRLSTASLYDEISAALATIGYPR